MRITKIDKLAHMPTRATPGSAGLDLRALDSGILESKHVQLVRTGISVEIPIGCVGYVSPRSGLALNYGITVINSPGVIDSDYRGEIGIIMYKHTPQSFAYSAGDRLAQLVIVQLSPDTELEEVPELSNTKRGAGGYGHTGQK